MNSTPYISSQPKTSNKMTSYYNGVPHSSGVSEISSAPPSPVSGSTPSAGAPRYGVIVPNRVFVGGIASNTTEAELQELFSQFGNIKEIKIISDRGGVCKGYGFVTFETEEEANKVRHQPDSLVLKERRLNIAPAVMKQQPFGRPYDIAPPTGALVYHNGTTYTYQNGMAFFPAQAAQTPYSRETSSMYAAPFGPAQSTPAPAYSSYPQLAMYTQPMPYLATGQQYQYPMPFTDYFKAVGPSQYIYAPPNALNGALNGGLGTSSQSPSPGYAQTTGVSGPGAELYYNGLNHHTPLTITHQPTMYPVESSPAHSEDWNPEPRQAHTPVVSLLKLHEEGSVEELEITRTPRKSYPPSGPRPRSRRLGPSPGPNPGQGQGPMRGASLGTLAGQRSSSSPHLPSTPNSCLHRSTSLSPSNQVTPAYNSSRQPHQAPHHHQLQHQQGYHPRRGGGSGSMRHLGPRSHSVGMGRLWVSSADCVGQGAPRSHNSQSSGHALPKPSNLPKNTGESVNGMKAETPTNSVNANGAASKLDKTVDEGGAGDAGHHTLPLSPPNTPLPGSGDGEVCQKMKALAL
ncbi:hypothetical protein ONE63_001893 [Megalurothrips usitatus]|uniref:RRM domain-containing protein n=1 Tax=Megalurothrips usitatus TaxID=439358 RepID=A0AAV7XGM7_9NEOP|nr:hypothetical protein ONE63_001893 [Megalurothrips usitatus]